MCYALAANMQSRTVDKAEGDDRVDPNSEQTPGTEVDGDVMSPLAKRRASATLEHSLTKAAKSQHSSTASREEALVDGEGRQQELDALRDEANTRVNKLSVELQESNDERDRLPSERMDLEVELENEQEKFLNRSTASQEENIATVTSVQQHPETDCEDWKQMYHELRDKANFRVKKLKRELRGVTDERDELRGEKAEMKTELEDEQKRSRKARGTEVSKKISRRIEDDTKKKYERKYAEWQAKIERSHELKLAGTEQALQKKIDELKEKKEDAEQDAKDAKAASTSMEKDLKREYADLRKRLRVEQQAEIRKHKPESCAEIKEARERLKTSEQRVQVLEREIQKARQEMGEAQHEMEELRRRLHGLQGTVQVLEEAAKVKDDFALGIGREYARERAELEARLVLEGERWVRQKACSDELGRKLVAQQRTNFVLRGGVESGVEKVARLEGEVMKLRERGSARSEGVEVGTQTEEVLGKGDEGGAAPLQSENEGDEDGGCLEESSVAAGEHW